MEFEWDDDKAASNEAKHRVSFEEAKSVFFNPLAVIFRDEEHSDKEDRELVIGHSQKDRLLLVAGIIWFETRSLYKAASSTHVMK